MILLPQEIIRQKRDQKTLVTQDIQAFFSAYLKGDVADYQVTAMLMAMWLNGLSFSETAALTMCMRDSGDKFLWPEYQGCVVDKHSTGGIGDKTSFIILPLLALEGFKVPMIAGRGLGHTGGTLDKLEAIPGMSVNISKDQARKLIAKHGGVFMGQTEQIAPLDKRLYALRDVTSTVESLPLICASILSKKLCEGLDSLVIDVKYGSGAFIEDKAKSKELGVLLKTVAEQCGVKTKIVQSSMSNPLGRYAGNALEIYETIKILKNETKGFEDTLELSLVLAEEVAHACNPKVSTKHYRAKFLDAISSGRAYEKFSQIIRDQGGDTALFEKEDFFLQAKIKHPLAHSFPRKMWVSEINTRELGLAIIALGGGRRLTTDTIEPFVGLTDLTHVGESIEAMQPFACIYSDTEEKAARAETYLRKAYKFSEKPVEKIVLVSEII